MRDYKVKIIDSETTGLICPQPIEIASIELDVSYEIVSSVDLFFKPTKEIEPGAKATHHILMSDLEGKQEVNSLIYNSDLTDILLDTKYIIGHNIDYDFNVLLANCDTFNKDLLEKIKRIDTLAIARYIFPNLSSHSQSALLYHFHGDEARELLKNAHNALADIENNRVLFKYLLPSIQDHDEYHHDLSLDEIESIYNFSELCRVPKVMPFGKHKGELISEIPYSYIKWILSQPDLDIYLEKALRKIL